MMIDTNLNFRYDFDVLYLTKKKIAICQASAFIESQHLDVELTLEKKVLKLRKALELHKKKIDDFPGKEYLNFADNDHQLYNIFSAYLLFHHRDEEAILQESLILNETYKQLSQLLMETKAQLSLFPFSDFLNTRNDVFNEINQQPFGTDVFDENIDLDYAPDPSYEQLFDQSSEQGTLQCEKRIAEFKRKYPTHKIRVAGYQIIVLHEQKKLRMEFHKLVYPIYYQLLPEKENLKRIFVKNCSLNINNENHQIELSKTIVLDEMIKFFENELREIDEDLICTPSDFDFLAHQMNDIISIMVPDCDAINQFQKAITLATQSMAGRKPILFIIEDLVDSFERIYRPEIKKIQHLFYYQSSESKLTYILEQIKDLEYMESNLPGYKATLKPYIVDLKNHLRSELDYVESQKNHKQTKMGDFLHEAPIHELKPESHKILAFNYNGIKDDKLALVLIALIKLKAISPLTTLPQLRAIVNGRKVTDPLEWLATQGDLMTFIKETVRVNEQRFTSYNQHWNIAVKCFVKKGGIELFDPQKLRLSKPTLLEEKFKEAARKFK